MSRKSLRNRRPEVPKPERPEQAQEPPRNRRFGDYFTPEWVTAWGTILLAVFAFFAWREATEGTKAIQGQLKAMLADQEPLLTASATDGPSLDAPSSRIMWPVRYVNMGKGTAYDFRAQTFMRLHDVFEPNKAELDDSLDKFDSYTLIPQDVRAITIFSGDGFSQTDLNDVIWASTIGVLLHVRYRTSEDGALKEQWFCFGQMKNGIIVVGVIPICLAELPRQYGGTKD
jgi:hypothetical protein